MRTKYLSDRQTIHQLFTAHSDSSHKYRCGRWMARELEVDRRSSEHIYHTYCEGDGCIELLRHQGSHAMLPSQETLGFAGVVEASEAVLLALEPALSDGRVWKVLFRQYSGRFGVRAFEALLRRDWRDDVERLVSRPAFRSDGQKASFRNAIVKLEPVADGVSNLASMQTGQPLHSQTMRKHH